MDFRPADVRRCDTLWIRRAKIEDHSTYCANSFCGSADVRRPTNLSLPKSPFLLKPLKLSCYDE